MAGVVLSVYIGGAMYIMEKQLKPLDENKLSWQEECAAEELAGDRRIRETDLWNGLAGEKN